MQQTSHFHDALSFRPSGLQALCSVPVLETLHHCVGDLVINESHQNAKEDVDTQLGVRGLRVPQKVPHCPATHHTQLSHTHTTGEREREMSGLTQLVIMSIMLLKGER